MTKKSDPSAAIAKHVASIAEPITPMFITFVLGACMATAITVGVVLPKIFPPTAVALIVTLCTGIGIGWATLLGNERKAHVASRVEETLRLERERWDAETTAAAEQESAALARLWTPESLLASIDLSMQNATASVVGDREVIHIVVRYTCPSPVPFALTMKAARVLITDTRNVEVRFAALEPVREDFNGFTRHRRYIDATLEPLEAAKGLLTELRDQGGFVQVRFFANFEAQVDGYEEHRMELGAIRWTRIGDS